MITDADCSRRDLLKLAAGSSLIPVLSGWSTGCGLIQSDLEKAAQRMIETLNHLDRAREIGEAYVAEASEVRSLSPEQLTRKLLALLDIDPGEISGATLNAVEGRLQDRVRQDFVDEEVVTLGKWMFSRTEALLCALAAIKA